MELVCSDLESVLFPEIWPNIAKRTKIKDLELTTRDIPNYEALMEKRLKALEEHKVRFRDIQKIIHNLKPLRGAVSFLNHLRKKFQVIILTDSFYEFMGPVMERFSYPTIFCNSLEISKDGFIKNCQIKKNLKLKAVKFLKRIGFKVIAVGDSYNDLGMLKEADLGILFNPSKKLIKQLPELPAAKNYSEVKSILKNDLSA